jgi:tetratricopeptide (TPR) repeat protein
MQIKDKLVKKFFFVFFFLFSLTVTAQVKYDYFLRAANGDLMRKNYVDAVKKLNIAITYNPEGFEAYFLRGIAKFSLGDFEGAASDFTKTLDIHALYTRAYFYRGICRDRLYDYSHALSDYDKALDIDPFNPDIFTARGDTRLHVHDYQGAIEDYSKAIQLDSKNAGAYLNRGIARHFLEQDSAALLDINKAVKLDYFNMDAWLRRGMIYYETDSLQKALSDFNHAITLDSSYLLTFFQRGLTYLKLGDTTNALADYNKVLKLDSTNSLTYYNRALVYSMQRKYKKALKDYNEVVALNPMNIYGYFNRGVTYFALKQYKDAEKDFSKAIELFPDFVGAYINRASVRMQLGNQKGAYRDQSTAKQIIAKVNGIGEEKELTRLYQKYSDSSYFNRIMEFEADFVSGNMKKGRIQFNRGKIVPKPDFFIINTFPLPDSVYSKYKKDEYFDTHFTQFNASNTIGIKLAFTTRQWPVSKEKALDELRRYDSSILITTGDTAGSMFIKGVINSMLQNYSVAIKAYDKTIEKNPSFVYAYFNRAASRVELEEFIYSEQQYKNAISITMSSSHNKTDVLPPPDHKKSLEDYDKVTKLYPNLPFTYYNRANLKTLLKDFQGAINDYSKAIYLEPNLAEAYFNRALTLLYLQEYKLACKDLSKAGELGIKESYNIIKRYCQN